MSKAEQIGGQVIEELDELIVLANEYKVKSYLEIGAREGIALRYFVERVPSIQRVFALDLPGADWGRAGSEAALRDNIHALDVQQTRIIIGDSTDQTIINSLRGCTFGVVFIDGDHSYEGVRSDFNNYRYLARDFVCLHDINHPPDSRAYGPTKLWNELYRLDRQAIIAERSSKGIGVLFV